MTPIKKILIQMVGLKNFHLGQKSPKKSQK